PLLRAEVGALAHERRWVVPRSGWIVVLVLSLVASVTAGFAIATSGAPADVGSIEVADQSEASGQDTSEQTAQPSSDDERAGAAPAVPEVSRSSAQPEQDAPTEQPTRLRVADVGLDAPIDATGVRDDGLMEIPDDGERVGWYRFGAAPGSGTGSVVIAGHVDTAEGLGAMAALREVPVGALVEVQMSDGVLREYEIVGRETVPKDDLPTAEIFERGGPERLTLITCGGPWRNSESSYRDNVVVVATPTERR
ncbi:MAG: class F sortase, partial [Ornithinimicrobium sp.]